MVTEILIVEDDAVLRTILAMYLTASENVLLAVDSLRGGLEALAARPFDLVISDVHLGDGSGLDVARRARARLGEEVTVVLTSGDDIAPHVAQGAGADDFLQKPLDLPALVDRCGALMVRRGKRLGRGVVVMTRPAGGLSRGERELFSGEGVENLRREFPA